MNEESDSSPVEAQRALESWKESRSGAWAGRGFRYQYLISALILVRQWAGLAPPGYVVPEGFEDCVLESSHRRLWIQVKSREGATFRDAEVRQILDAVDSKTARLENATDIRSVVILEQPRTNKVETGIDRLFDDENQRVFVCGAPGDEIVRLLSTKLETAEVIAEGLASDLYKLVADASAENASLPFDKRRKISTTEVGRRIFERLEAEDPSAMDHALVSGALEPVDFTTPVDEPDFYRGVKVKVGHVAANLVLDRPYDVNKILDALWQGRHVLVSGPSGAGKSALVWLAATAVAGQFRWFQITGMATAAHAEAIIRSVRARRPTEMSPIGLVFDEVGSANSDLWDVLVRELRGFPALYFLGSVRQEDVNLVANQSDTVFIPVILDEDLAETVWEKLSAGKQTNWTHWREPFEQSEGLMLEYVHLLTQGRRLAAVIGEQIRQREHENRNDELTIVRSAAVLCARGGEVAAGRLFELLDLEPDAANRALRRLIDEHLVRESRPGILGGLHMLRSDALVKASHDETVFLAADTLWGSLPATTTETLPRVVQSVLADSGANNEPQSLRKLAEMLSKSRDIDQWTAILTGLGLATLERHVASFMSMLERHGVQRAHWSLASRFADPQLDVPVLSGSEQLRSLRNAVLAFRKMPKHDLRATCLEQCPEGSAPPRSDSILQANRLLSCLVPICGGDPIRIALDHEFLADRNADIRQIAGLLSTAYLINPDLAESLADTLGGERVLLSLFHSQIPWTTPPVIEPDGTHGRTIRSDWHHVAEPHQPDPHETVCEICEMLMGLSPHSDAAASDAVDPMGRTIAVADYKPWSKNMPRANIPAKARVAWNVAFRQILLARAAADSLTDYTRQMASLVRRTEKVFRSFTEKWIRGKHISNAAALTSERDEIVDAVNALAYAAPDKPPSAMTEPVRAGTDDTLGALLTGVLGNLIPRLSKLETTKAPATFAGSLRGQAREHHQSGIWRTMSSPPLTELAKLSERLGDVSCILHEMAHDSRPEAIQRIVKAARKASIGSSVRTAARYCRHLADRRFEVRLRELENALGERGWKARCLSRPVDQCDSGYWPAREVAILVEIADFETQWGSYVEEPLSLGKKHLGHDWPYRTVPIVNGQVLASLALRPSSHMPFPDEDFAREWSDCIDKTIFSAILVETFDEAIAACMHVSAIIACRDLQDLHPEEDQILSKALDIFKKNRAIVANAAERTGTDHLAFALEYLDRNWNRIVDEFEAVKAGQAVEDPLCMTPHRAIAGDESKHAAELAATRLVILQAECSSAVANGRTQTTDSG